MEIKHVFGDNDLVTYSDENGLLHRHRGPARKDSHSSEYYKHGKLHRIGGPAIIRKDLKAWFVNGKRHRIGAPCFIKPGLFDGEDYVEYRQHGELHREDGPAVPLEYTGSVNRRTGKPIYATVYALNGVRMTRAVWKRKVKAMTASV